MYVCSTTCTVDLINKIPFIFDMQTVVGTQIFIPQNFFIKENSGSCVLIMFKTHLHCQDFSIQWRKTGAIKDKYFLSLTHSCKIQQHSTLNFLLQEFILKLYFFISLIKFSGLNEESNYFLYFSCFWKNPFISHMLIWESSHSDFS